MLTRSGVLRQALRAELIELALAEAGIPLPMGEELQGLLQTFWRQQQLAPPLHPAWLAQRDLGEADLAAMVSRPQRWRLWCHQEWGQKRAALFLKHKNQLDVATASLLRLEEKGLAQELYLQLTEQESSFAELARTHCQDHPQRQGGQWGPKPLSELPPRLAELLRTTPVGQLRGPERLGPADWWCCGWRRSAAAGSMIRRCSSACCGWRARPGSTSGSSGGGRIRPEAAHWQ